MVFGWAHGLGFVGLCIVIWIAAVRREAPYTLLAATLTPVGPVGSVIGIELIERKGWGVAAPAVEDSDRAQSAADRVLNQSIALDHRVFDAV